MQRSSILEEVSRPTFERVATQPYELLTPLMAYATLPPLKAP
jgi:hypothetical protein